LESSRTVITRCFELNPVDVFELFQVFEGVIIVGFDDLVDFPAQPLFDAGIVADVVNHHHQQVRRCIGPRDQKSAEFIDKILSGVFELIRFSFAFILLLFLVKRFHQISFYFRAFTLCNLSASFFYKGTSILFEGKYIGFYFSQLFCYSPIKSILS
jgi:hypothetical protein